MDCGYDEFIKTVKDYIVNNPNARVYCFMHWNYDLEWLPFPMQRTISRQLIDAGVSGVIGGHSHRPQGMEEYKGKPIAYCMGNFYLPSGYYFDGKLSYPPCSKSTYAVRIKDDVVDIPWFHTDKNSAPLELQTIESFINGDNCKLLSPFINMSHQDYIRYFARNRDKKILVPLFTEPFGNKYLLDEKWAIMRVKIIRFLKGVIKR